MCVFRIQNARAVPCLMPPSFKDCFGRPRSRKKRREKAQGKDKNGKKTMKNYEKLWKTMENYGKRKTSKERRGKKSKTGAAIEGLGQTFLDVDRVCSRFSEEILANCFTRLTSSNKIQVSRSRFISDFWLYVHSMSSNSWLTSYLSEPARRQNLPRLLSARNQSLLPDSRK